MRIPDLLPSVQPAGASPVAFTQRSSPDDFGAAVGRGEGAVAGALQQTADQSFGVAKAQLELDNETNAKEAATQFDRKAIDLAFDPKSGFMGKYGKDAIDGYDGALDAAEKIRRDTLDGLNPRAREMADGVIVKKLANLQQTMASHAQQQRKVWMTDTSNARISSTQDDAVNNYNNEKIFGQAVATIKGEVLSQGEMNGWSPEMTANAQRAAVSKAWVARVDRMATDDPMGALDLYRANMSEIDGAAHIAVEKTLKAASLPVLTRGVANRVLSGAPQSDVEALRAAVAGQESGGSQAAVSDKGAIGVMQLMPDTAREVAGTMGLPFDPKKLAEDENYNRALGNQYLDQMLQRYKGNQTLALAAYNAGPGRVDRWLAMYGDPNSGAISSAAWADKIPIKETKEYVAAINAKVPEKAGTMPTATDVRTHLGEWVDQARSQAKAIWPNNPEAVDQAVGHVITYANQISHGQQFAEKAARDTLLTAALGLSKTPDGAYVQTPKGQRPASLEELLNSSPDAKKAWATMEPIQQSGIISVLEHNAKGTSPPMTDAALGKFYALQGMAGRDPEQFRGVNLADPEILKLLPHEMTVRLMNEQSALDTKQGRDAAHGERLAHAVAVAKPTLLAVGLKTDGKAGTAPAEKYDQFVGRLSEAVTSYVDKNKKAPTDDEVRAMTHSLLADGYQAGSGWIFTDKAKLFQSPDQSKWRATIPPGERGKLVSDGRKVLGREPTDSELEDAYTAQLLMKAGPRR